VATFADSVLVARTESVSPFNSLVPATALTEALVAGVSALRDDAGRERASAVAELTEAVAREAGGQVSEPERRRMGS
jgi:DNA-binding MurR/RpiR family transcriptional regulator